MRENAVIVDQGYLNGWRPVRDEKEQPAIPEAPEAAGKSM
jgi:hypothetical protein